MNIENVCHHNTTPGDFTYMQSMVSNQLQHIDYDLVDNQYVWTDDRSQYRFVCDTNVYTSLGIRPTDIVSREIIKLFPGKGPWTTDKYTALYESILVPTGWHVDIQTPPWGSHTRYNNDPERNIKWGGVVGDSFLLNAGITYRMVSAPPDFVYVNKILINKDFGELIK